MPLTVITSDQISTTQQFSLSANLVMGNTTMTPTSLAVGNSSVYSNVAAGSLLATASITSPIHNSGTNSTLQLQSNGALAIIADTVQNVGIGTSSPSSYGKLAVVSTTAGSAKISIQDTSGGSAAPVLQFGLNDTSGFNTADAARVWTTAASSSVASLNFAAYNGGAPSTAQMVLTGNSVGIGTSSPASFGKLVSATNFANSWSTSLTAKALGTAQGQLAGITFAPTFQGTADNGVRRAADIWAGFNGGNWSTEYLSFGVGYGGTNDNANTTIERARVEAGGLSVFGYMGPRYLNTIMAIQPVFSVPPGKTKATFSCTGANQSWTVPAGVTSILVKIWGAGGGGGNSGGWNWGSRGGGGGHTIAILPVTPGQVLGIVVGQGGQTNYAGGQTPNYGGGGGMYNNSDNRYAGGGGGYSGVFSSTTISQATALAIAGGGGGGGCSRMVFGNWGGAGGGLVGQAGSSSYDSRYTSGGGGGTQSSGGAAGPTQNAQGGGAGALTGGYGASNAYGGGGGGGYYGGGGGGYYESNTMAGGGGGSGFVAGTAQFGMTFAGNEFRPAMYDDSDLPKTYDGYNNWNHYAMGGDPVVSSGQYTSAGGGSGFIAIYY